MKEKIIATFNEEFSFIKDKFIIMDLLENGSEMDAQVINYLKLPSIKNNIVWHPGVYFFIGNNQLYRVGVSMKNSRERVMQHLENCTSENEHGIWDINNYPDKSILLINVRDKKNKFWLLAIECFFEMNFNPLIKAKRIG